MVFACLVCIRVDRTCEYETLCQSLFVELTWPLPHRVFLQAVEKKFPGDKERLARMSLIEGAY